MSDLIIVHHPYQGSNQKFEQGETGLVWETCRRRLIFFDEHSFSKYLPTGNEEIYSDIEAEEFLIEVLCGLKSPLVGETEVFGQFKLWWQNSADSDFKRKYDARIQQIYAVVKRIREESLCGLGSQSYGSLLRKKIAELKSLSGDVCIDFVGSGQLVEEMIPWVEKKWKFRIWCRNPERIENSEIGQKAVSVKKMTDESRVSDLLVVAAPLSHDELNFWIKKRSEGENLHVFDFRHDSMEYNGTDQFRQFLHLDHFTSEVEEKKQQIQIHIEEAKTKINSWKHNELNRAQVRPFGWDDL